MIYLRDLLLYCLVALHLTGGAALFRRLFPRESAWLGFIIPSLVIALICNFLEHGIALTGLHWLLPVTTLGAIGLLVSPKTNWRLLWKPTVVFLVALAIPFTLRCILPIISIVRDGPEDLALMANFCMGGTLPPDSTWMPGFKVLYYYDFAHYAASVVIRLFGLDPGTGFNVMSALLAGLILFCTGGIAYRLGQRRLWVALLIMVMTAAAMNGITDDLWLNHPNYKTPSDATNLFYRCGPDGGSAYQNILPRMKTYWDTHELIPPGYWCWVGSFHSATAGQFLVLFSVLCLIEMFDRRRTNWPWIGALLTVPLLLVSSTWDVPIAAAFFLAGAIWCVRRGIQPRNWRFVLFVTAGGCMCLAPMLSYFLRVNTPPTTMPAGAHTPLFEFLMQWWPVYLPWLLLFFWWRRLHPVVRILQVLLPILFLAVECTNVGARVDTTGKIWGCLFAAGWAAFLPSMLAMRSWTLRAVFTAFFSATVISVCFWVDDYRHTIWWEDMGRLSGEGELRTDSVKTRIFDIVSATRHQTIIADDYMLASLSGNRVYLGDTFDCYLIHQDAADEAWRRADNISALYAGKMPRPLDFLLANHIAMLVVWPNRHVDPAIVASLQTQLAADYAYAECRDQPFDPTASQAGVYAYRGAAAKDSLAPALPFAPGYEH